MWHSLCHMACDKYNALFFSHGGQAEILFGLNYSPLTGKSKIESNDHTNTTRIQFFFLGRLSVELLKGSHFRNLTTQKAPDTFVTLTLLDGNCKVWMSHLRTSADVAQVVDRRVKIFLGSYPFKINDSKISTKSSLQRIILFSSRPLTTYRYYSSYFSIF